MDEGRRICDYEGTDYYGDFWAGQGRDYEDLAERIALRRLLPQAGRRLLDIGGGYGRLSEFYPRYDEVVLLDYSRSLLRQAQSRLGRDGRIRYVAANVYGLPFVQSAFDTVLMVRVMHHLEDVPGALSEIARCLAGGGAFVLEFANKQHLKNVVRYALRRQSWSPFDPEPYEFVKMHFDFHPRWMQARLGEAGFHVKHAHAVSYFRLPVLKRLVPARALAALDGLVQPTGRWWQWSPSIFLRAQLAADKAGEVAPAAGLFRCPACGSGALRESAEALACLSCTRCWPIDDGLYDFKAPLPV